MRNKYVSRRNYDEEKIKKNILKRKISVWLVIIILIPTLLYISSYVLRQKHYLFISMFMLVAVMLPFFVSFEYKAIRAREIVLFAMMVSFCVSFNLLCAHTIPLHGGSAVVVLSGIALGPEAGFLTGALGRFICNFFDGQGPWTPWQMIAFGIIGFLSGVLFSKKNIKYAYNKWIISIYGFLATFVIYGFILDTATVFMYTDTPKTETFVATYLSGIGFNLIHSASTFVVLFLI